jgi:hypothetical protein
LEQSWFREIQLGYNACHHYENFDQYMNESVEESKKCSFRRDHSLLHFLGAKRKKGQQSVNLTDACLESLNYLEKFDFINVMEDKDKNREMFQTMFGWDDFTSTKGPSKSRTAIGNTNRSYDEHFQLDYQVYDRARYLSNQHWQQRKQIMIKNSIIASLDPMIKRELEICYRGNECKARYDNSTNTHNVKCSYNDTSALDDE